MEYRQVIYLDYQATTPVDAVVLREMAPYMSECFGNPHSSDHSLGWEAARAVESAAARVGRLIGSDPDEIIFTSGATEANNLALLGLGRRAVRGKRRRILVSAIEHKCVLAVSRVLREQLGYRVDQIPVDSKGRIQIAALEESLDEDVLLVSIMAVNNEIGTIQDIGRIAALAKKVGSIFHCDAAQAPMAIDTQTMSREVDLLSLSSHKMYGPKGIGVLYIGRELMDRIEPLVYGGGQQYGLRSGTVPVALCVGMGAAANKFVANDIEAERNTLQGRRDRFIEMLMALPWRIELNGPQGDDCHPGNANIRFSEFCAADILSVMQPRIAASTGSACTSGIPEPSHVLRAIGLDGNESEASIRFSLGFGTTDAHIDQAVEVIQSALSRLGETNLSIASGSGSISR